MQAFAFSVCFPFALEFPVPETACEVVINHAYRLHEGVADFCPDELEPSFLQILTHGIRLGSARGDIGHCSP